MESDDKIAAAILELVESQKLWGRLVATSMTNNSREIVQAIQGLQLDLRALMNFLVQLKQGDSSHET